MTNQEAITIINDFRDKYYFDLALDDALSMAIKSLNKNTNSKLTIEPPSKEQLEEDFTYMSNKEVAKKYFVSVQKIHDWRKMYGMISLTFAQRVSDDEFADAFLSGRRQKDIASDYGVSIHTIRQRAKNMELKRSNKLSNHADW